MNIDDMLEALFDLVGQFGHVATVNGEKVISSGGLSALENGFRALQLPDPCPYQQFIDEQEMRT